MLRSRTRWVLMLGVLCLAGCRHIVPAPYARGQGPEASELLARTGAQLPALQVSRAKVTANRTLRGNLAFLAEAPSRFRGTVQIAGNELVTLAFHEQGYALRYKMDAFPEGYYAGPPSGCAVEALLGVTFETNGLVDLVLGGSPVLEAPYEVLDQKWQRRGGYEMLVIANARFVQELRFGWVANEWRVTGGQLWERNGDERGRRLWTMEHMELEPQGGVYLPTKTKVSTPGKRRDDTVVINYKERDTDPAFAKRGSSSGGDGGEDGGDDGDPWEDDDPWEDEGGWEDGEPADDDGGWEDGAEPADGDGGQKDGAEPADDDGGWEDGAEPAEGEGGEGASDEGSEGEPDGTPAPEDVRTEPKAPPKKEKPKPQPAVPPPKVAIPQEFLLEPTGLTVRGDLCR